MNYIQRLFAILLLSCLSLSIMAKDAEKKPIPAPDFRLPQVNGPNFRLFEQRGRVLLINFWASWCSPCRQEIPELKVIQDQFGGKDFSVIGVSMDHDEQEALRFIGITKPNYPLLLDLKQQVVRQYNIETMPTTLIVDREGKIRDAFFGYEKGYEAEYKKQIRTLLDDY